MTVLQGPLSTVVRLRVQGVSNSKIGALVGKPSTVNVPVQELNQWIHGIEQLESRVQELERAERNRIQTPSDVKLGLIKQLMSRALVFTAKNRAVLKFVPLDDLEQVMETGQLPAENYML